MQCLIHESALGAALSGQDTLLTTYVCLIKYQAGTANPHSLELRVGSANCTQQLPIVSIPIYDGTALGVRDAPSSQSTSSGFLQVFINYVDANGNPNVTVMNVAGCGNGVIDGTPSLNGTSPVPVRLITPP